MIKPLSTAIACILLASISAHAHAQAAAQAPAADDQQDDQAAKKKTPSQLDTVIVTGTRSPKAVDKIPGAVTVVTEEEVQHTLNLTEDATAVLARTVPGYAESTQAMSNTGENLRGRIALRLFDGVPQGSPLREGTRNATFTDMGVVGRIEVINGPSASEGIGAAGGIINYLSKVPTEEGNHFTLTTRYSTQFKDDSEGWKVGLNFAHKKGDRDLLVSAAHIDRGMAYDGNGRRVGMNTSGSVSDSKANNVFVKGGMYFDDGDQRLEASLSRFHIAGNGDYHQVEGCRFNAVTCPIPTTNTSERGAIAGTFAEFNDFKQYQLNYSHYAFFGGTLVLNAYKADQAMRYLPENGNDKQLVKVPPEPPGFVRIWEQSEIDSKKKGLRSSWTRPDVFGVTGLELRMGLDLVWDEAQQRLALTNRTWVPPMEYKSVAPWLQASWDIGPVTLSGGVRRQKDELHVDSYTTVAANDGVFVQGGGVDYNETLTNFGAVWRIGGGWSVFGSVAEGFTLPNIGIPLRNINAGVAPANRRVDRIADIAAIVVDNTEFGVNWRGERASLSASRYVSKTDFGASLSIDPVTNDFVLTRAPNEIKGYEVSGDYAFAEDWRATLAYSHASGMTSFYNRDPAGRWDAGPLLKPMGVLDISPDKLTWSLNWKFLPGGDINFGATRMFSRSLYGTDVRPFDGASFTYTEKTTGYTLYDLSIAYDTGRFGKLTLGVENLFDKQYILSWAQVPGFQNYWAGRGRMVSLTHTITF